MKILAPALLVAVASSQIALSRTVDLTPWKGGGFSELKTYGFACGDHVRDVLRDAEARWLDYEATPDEVVGYLAIFHFEPGVGDRRLARDYELEEFFAAE